MKFGSEAGVTGIIFEPNPETFGIDIREGRSRKSQVLV